jgi:hypothetical protein
MNIFGRAFDLATVIFILAVVAILTGTAVKYVELQRREYLGMRSEGIDRRAVYFDRLTGAVLIGPGVGIE